MQLAFDIYIIDIFYLMNGINIYLIMQMTLPCTLGDREVKNVITKLEQSANHLAKLFLENHMKLNESKCHLIIFGTSKEKVNIRVGEL